MQDFRVIRLLLLLAAATLLAALIACSAGDRSPLAQGANESQGFEALATIEGAPAQERASEDGQSTADPQQTDDVAIIPEEVNACLNCHADKEQLIATAAPEETIVEESEGEG